MAQILRGKSPAERLAIGAAMWRSARDMILTLLRAEHPDWTDEAVGREAARRLSHGVF
jgi:Rv0078B-related antitoxin